MRPRAAIVLAMLLLAGSAGAQLAVNQSATLAQMLTQIDGMAPTYQYPL